MSKKVLVISASPRKGGNSDVLCDKFADGATEAGNQVEKIFVGDKKIAYCTGCGFCNNRGNGCSQKDDMTDVLAKMVDADVIVMATPVYFYTMNGQLKTLIDRVCARYTEVSDKEFYFIMTAADTDASAMDATIESFRAFTSCLSGVKEQGMIIATGVWGKGEVDNTQFIEQAYEMGKNL